MKYLLKELLPPIVNTLRWFSFKYGWKGNYKTFEDAKRNCKGYDEKPILNKIVAATQEVVDGKALYERDGINYHKTNPDFPLLSTLLYIASKNDNELTVIDFGGSLGTSYHKNLPFLTHLKKIKWCIIEQKGFVEKGEALFTTNNLNFYYSIEECLEANPKPNLLLLSSSLQYIDKPYKLLSHLLSYHIPYLMLDLIAFNHKDEDRICIQNVPPVFYGIDASYPCTFFSKKKLYQILNTKYNLKYDFVVEGETYYINLRPFKYEGSLWEIKE